MNNISDLLLLILKSALSGTPMVTNKLIALSDKEWQALYKMSAKQGVLAIVYDVISQLPTEAQPPRNLRLQWAGSVLLREKRYDVQFAGAKSLGEYWHGAGISTVVIKGFSLSKYYPIPHHRECGDFDCFLLDGRYEDGNVLAEQLGATVNREWYKHSQIYYRGMVTENHNLLVATRKGKDVKELNATLIDMLRTDLIPIENTNLLLPPTSFTALFVTYHSFSHFLSEGITLRHLCDWACFMRVEQDSFDWETFYKLCKRHKFDRFVDISNEIITKYLGVELHNQAIVCENPYTYKLLEDVFIEDAKIYSSGKGRWHNRFKLIKNMFTYSWKHRDIAQSNNLRYFIKVISGFLFKRENH